jgi:hypothetical protein
MKISSNQGVISVYGSQETAERAEVTLQEPKIVYNIDEVEAQIHDSEKSVKEKASSADQPKLVLLCDDVAEQRVFFGNQLTSEQESSLRRFLFHNKDVFAWSANDLCGVNRSIIEHALNSVALSTAEAEYIAAGHCCAQLLWMRQTLRDYGYKLTKVPLPVLGKILGVLGFKEAKFGRSFHRRSRVHCRRSLLRAIALDEANPAGLWLQTNQGPFAM